MPLSAKKWGWSVYIRGKQAKGSIYYYQLKDPVAGAYTTALSTHTAIKSEAVRIAKREAARRDPKKIDNFMYTTVNVVNFIELFFDEEKSPWVLEQKAHEEHLYNSAHIRTKKSYFLRYMKQYIDKDMMLSQVTKHWLKQLQVKLRLSYPHLTNQTLNAIFSTVLQPLRYAASDEIIDKDPTNGIKALKPHNKITGVFSQEEVLALSSLEWGNSTGKLAFMLAIYTGMRIGELCALRKSDFECYDNSNERICLINISHSWSKTHGLKCPKNGKARVVPIPVWLWDQLQTQVGEGANDDAFVFASAQNGKPMSDKLLRAALVKSLELIGVSVQQQEERNLRFHSTRHYFNSALAPLVQNESLRKVIGHSSPEMTSHYHHVTNIELEMIAEAQKKAFPIIPFPVGEATA